MTRAWDELSKDAAGSGAGTSIREGETVARLAAVEAVVDDDRRVAYDEYG